MTLDQLLHLGEVSGLIMVSLIGFFAARTLVHLEQKLERHGDKLEDHGERIVKLETFREAARSR